MSVPKKPVRSDDIIRASEIGEYVKCHRAWWLGRVQGVENSNRAALDAGTQRHLEHGQRVRTAERLQQLAWVALATALIAAILLVLNFLGIF